MHWTPWAVCTRGKEYWTNRLHKLHVKGVCVRLGIGSFWGWIQKSPKTKQVLKRWLSSSHCLLKSMTAMTPHSAFQSRAYIMTPHRYLICSQWPPNCQSNRRFSGSICLAFDAVDRSLLCGPFLPLALGKHVLLPLFVIQWPTALDCPGLKGFWYSGVLVLNQKVPDKLVQVGHPVTPHQPALPSPRHALLFVAQPLEVRF